MLPVVISHWPSPSEACAGIMHSTTQATVPSLVPHVSSSDGGRGLGHDDRSARPDRGAEDDSTPGPAAAPLSVLVRKPAPHSALLSADCTTTPHSLSLCTPLPSCVSMSLCVSRSLTQRLGRLSCTWGRGPLHALTAALAALHAPAAALAALHAPATALAALHALATALGARACYGDTSSVVVVRAVDRRRS